MPATNRLDCDTIELNQSALHRSGRVEQRSAPLLRGKISESTEEPPIEIPLPLTEIVPRDTVRVLHVDDEPNVGEVTATFLERIDDSMDVVSEPSVVQALDRLEGEEFDCIVSDYQMPNTDGLEFLEIVRERHPDLPFILFTGKGSEEIACEAISAGVTDYMQKGAGTDTYEMLANRVSNAVEQYRTQQQFWNALSWYQRLVEQEIAGVFILQDSAFVYVNQKLAETFGYGQSELIGEPPETIVAEPEQELLSDLPSEPGGDGDDDRFQEEVLGQHREGHRLAVEIQGGAIEYNGDPAWIGVCSNIDE